MFDATSIIVGIIIGAGLYEVTPDIARCVTDLPGLVGVWALGGVAAVIGALCYAELVGRFPLVGGDYIFLSRAYGKKMAFVYAWAELWVVRPGSIGAVSYVFARYANQLLPLGSGPQSLVLYATGAIVVLSIVNVLGVREGKWTQNLLTLAKVGGLLMIFAYAWLGPTAAVKEVSAVVTPDFKRAMILVMFAYGGWSDVAYVAAEVRDARRNVLLALLLGIALVTLIYIAANLSFVHVLGLAGLQNAQAVATEMLAARGAERASQLVAALICVSTLGAINGQIFTGARIYYALGEEQPLYSRLGRWSRRFGTPAAAIMLQGAITLVPVIAFGLNAEGFGRLINFTTPVFWFFFALVGMSLFVLRHADVGQAGGFRVPWYPLLPLAFCLSSVFMLYASLTYAIEHRSSEALWSVIIMAVGYALSFYTPQSKPERRRRKKKKR